MDSLLSIKISLQNFTNMIMISDYERKKLRLGIFLTVKILYKLLVVVERSARFGEWSVRFGDIVGAFKGMFCVFRIIFR